MEIRCDYKLANEYRENLKEFGFEIPGPYLFVIGKREQEVITLTVDIGHLLKMLELFVELVRKGATATNLADEEIMVTRILESLRDLQNTS